MSKLCRCASLLLIATVLTVATPLASASADPTICEPGHKRVSIWSVKTPIKITHASVHILGAGVKRKITKGASFNHQSKSRIRLTGSAGASIGAKIKRMVNVKVGGTIEGDAAWWGKETSTSRYKVEDTIPASKRRARWVAFLGRRSSTGNWDSQRCSPDGRRWVQGPSGKYGSYSNIPVDAIVRCSANASGGSAVAKAIAVAC
jgi:hypothetical protein